MYITHPSKGHNFMTQNTNKQQLANRIISFLQLQNENVGRWESELSLKAPV